MHIVDFRRHGYIVYHKDSRRVTMVTDSGCVHGGEHGTTVYQVPAGGTEEQQARTRSPTDQTAGE